MRKFKFSNFLSLFHEMESSFNPRRRLWQIFFVCLQSVWGIGFLSAAESLEGSRTERNVETVSVSESHLRWGKTPSPAVVNPAVRWVQQDGTEITDGHAPEFWRSFSVQQVSPQTAETETPSPNSRRDSSLNSNSSSSPNSNSSSNSNSNSGFSSGSGPYFLSLSGEWEFAQGNHFLRWRMGKDEPGWEYEPVGKRSIQVPGTWESQGVGEPGPSRTWDCKWDCTPVNLRNQYIGPALYRKEVKIPETWAGKQIWLKIGGVNADAYLWINGKKAAYVNTYCETLKFNVTSLLKIGETNQITAFVRNDIPSRKGLLVSKHAFGGFYRDVELEAVPDVWIDEAWVRGRFADGAAVVRAEVRCSENFRIQEKANSSQGESQSDSGRKVSALNASSSQFRLSIRILDAEGKTAASAVVPAVLRDENAPRVLNGEQEIVIPIPGARPWTPEIPYLYTAQITLLDADGKALHGWGERFGVREMKVVGTQFFLNGKPYFLRGCGDHNFDPLKIVQGPSRYEFAENLKRIKAAGFNFARHHTHSPLPEYFEAADEIGMLLMPELPYYHDVPTDRFEFNPMRDLAELFRTNRRYVSFAAYSTGNEGFLGDGIDVEVYRWVKKNDPDRLIQHQDGGKNTLENSDFDSPNGYGKKSSILPWTPGEYRDLKFPFVAHEYLNLAIKPNPYLEPKYSGAELPVRTLDSYRKLLEECGLSEEWGQKCITAGERLQAHWQKQGLEQARMDPDCDGYGFWSISDAGAASQGLFTQFYQLRENGWSFAELQRFNGPTALLLDSDRTAPIAVSGERIPFRLRVSHFDAHDFTDAAVRFQLVLPGKDEKAKEIEKVFTSVELPVGKIPAGTARQLAETVLDIPQVSSPQRAEIRMELLSGGKSAGVLNQWDFWIFPKREKKELHGAYVTQTLQKWISERYSGTLPFDCEAIQQKDTKKRGELLLIASAQDEAEIDAAIRAGMRIFILSPASEQPDVKLGWWSLGTQIGTAFEDDSPIWKDFPARPYMDALWFRLIRKGAHDLRYPTAFGRLKPFAVSEGANSYALYLGEGKVSAESKKSENVQNESVGTVSNEVRNGTETEAEQTQVQARILVTFALALMQDQPEALALLDVLLDYVRSSDFQPTRETGYVPPKRTAPEGTKFGLGKVLKVPPMTQNSGFFAQSYRETLVKSFTVRQMELGQRLEWLTDPVSAEEIANAKDSDSVREKTLRFVWAGGMGFLSQKETDGFRLWVNGKAVLDFNHPPAQLERKLPQKFVWKSADGLYELTFEVRAQGYEWQDLLGKFTLKVPASAVRPNEPLPLAVESLGAESLRWFSLHSLYDLRD